MPELPEVEISYRGIKQYLIGTIIISVSIRNGCLRWPVSDEIYALKKEPIINIQRRAKYILLKLVKGWIIIHLGMSGSLRIISKELPIEKHDHIDLIMSNGKILRYTDPRRFGSWIWTKTLVGHHLLAHLGPEPLSSKFNTLYLQRKCVNKKTSIKSCLMDNKIVVGIGNIYANESLFIAKINPHRLALSISKQECFFLVQAIKLVLQHSIECGGTSIKNYLQSNGKPGSFNKQLNVYNRKNEPCRICGAPILTSRHIQRITFYCYQCQK